MIPSQPSILIRGATAILTGAAGAASRVAGPDIRLRGESIEAIGPLAPQPGETVVDARDCVVYPAWVNTHHHLFQSLLKGDPAGLNATLTPWLTATPYRLRPWMTEQQFRLAARIGLIELMLSGCGTVADHNYLYSAQPAFDSSAILFDEARRLGLRFVLCRGGQTRARPQEAELPASMRPESLDGYLADLERLAGEFHDPSPTARTRVVAAPTTPLFSMAPAELREVASVSRRLGLRLHSHLSETVSYQEAAWAQARCSPIEFCERLDWLGPDVWFAHLVKLSTADIALLGRTGTGIAHCPQSNGRLGSGIAPVRELEAAGARVSIGVDGAASNEAADMFSETHAAWLMQRAKGGEAAVADLDRGGGERGADAATIEDVVRWGTSGGAAILGLDGVGTLAVGQAADLAVYRLDQPRHFGVHDPAIAPVACGGQASLRALFVAGRRIVDEGVVDGVDLPALAAHAREAVAALRAAAGDTR